jgi:hypothetical protein
VREKRLESKAAEETVQSEESKRESVRNSLHQLLGQLNSKSTNPNERRQIEMFKQMLPLYEKHDFWDTQPVPKSGLGDDSVLSPPPIYLILNLILGAKGGCNREEAGEGCEVGALQPASGLRVGRGGPDQ